MKLYLALDNRFVGTSGFPRVFQPCRKIVEDELKFLYSVRPSPFHFSPLNQPWEMSVEYWWNGNWHWKSKFSENPPSPSALFLPQSRK